MQPTLPQLLRILITAFLFFAFSASTLKVSAQKNAKETDYFVVRTGGTFNKPAITPKLEKLAIAQVVVKFKNATTKTFEQAERGLFGRKKMDGAHVSGRLTAYLETTDGNLSEADYQELADYFYHTLNQSLVNAGIDTIAWNAITATEFYKEAKEADDEKLREEQKKGGQIYTQANANHGNTLWGGTIGFAFGKIKKAAKFCEALGAPAVFMQVTIDFADIIMDGEGHSGTKETPFSKITTKVYKFNSSVDQNIKVVPDGTQLFYNQKMQSEAMVQQKEIPSGYEFASAISQDENKAILKRPLFTFSKDFKATPVVIETTRAQYKTAVRKAMDNYAVNFAAQLNTKK